MCTHTQNGFTDKPKERAWTLFQGRYFIDTDEAPFLRGTFLLLHIASNSSAHYTKNHSHVHNSAS
jgi:hypothetical protein